MTFDEHGAAATRILIVDDSEHDAELIARVLNRGGCEATYARVDTRDAMHDALTRQEWDLIIADYSMPTFDGLAALHLMHDARVDVPFLLVSGTVGEEVAVQAMRAGAHDYILKTNLTRLPLAVARELREAQVRRSQKRAEDRYRNLFEHVPIGVLSTTPDGRILDANPAFIEMLGFESLLDARRTNISELWSQPEARDRLKDLLARNGVVRDFEVEWQRRDGRTLWTSLSLRAMCDIRGTIDYFEGVAVDITERRRAHLELQQHRQELERSNEDLEHFAYVASHDLREPLRMVGGFAELFAQRYKGKLDNTADEFISYMIDGVRRMDSLITMLLQYSRAGKDDNFGPVDMNSIMKRTLLNLGSVIEESSSQITCDTLPLVNGDETALGNVMLNLISNGIKFRGEQQPKIHISAEDAGDKWVISVADNGIGFEPQFNEAVFTMFRRLHTQAEYPGSGIGLAICKRIIERHGGHIWVESQPGKGSVFHLSFEKLLTPLRPNLAP